MTGPSKVRAQLGLDRGVPGAGGQRQRVADRGGQLVGRPGKPANSTSATATGPAT
jgi:hypothetical protein